MINDYALIPDLTAAIGPLLKAHGLAVVSIELANVRRGLSTSKDRVAIHVLTKKVA